jgi:hypothetical protein
VLKNRQSPLERLPGELPEDRHQAVDLADDDEPEGDAECRRDAPDANELGAQQEGLEGMAGGSAGTAVSRGAVGAAISTGGAILTRTASRSASVVGRGAGGGMVESLRSISAGDGVFAFVAAIWAAML